jgi:hypothetical protein
MAGLEINRSSLQSKVTHAGRRATPGNREASRATASATPASPRSRTTIPCPVACTLTPSRRSGPGWFSAGGGQGARSRPARRWEELPATGGNPGQAKPRETQPKSEPHGVTPRGRKLKHSEGRRWGTGPFAVSAAHTPRAGRT